MNADRLPSPTPTPTPTPSPSPSPSPLRLPLPLPCAGVPAAFLDFAASLTPAERDALKFRLSVAAARELERDFELSADPARRARFFQLLRCMLAIQPFARRVPPHGLAYRGRPDFMSDALVQGLRDEAVRWRPRARENFEQFIVTIDTPDDSTLCERLASSAPLFDLVTRCAGPCLRSYISSYIYYDAAGQCSKPHVDNAFTSVTVMIGLRSEPAADVGARPSASVAYWPDSAPFEYRLAPGEMAVFFGVCVLHGRHPVARGETVHSLLLSFRPRMEDGVDGEQAC